MLLTQCGKAVPCLKHGPNQRLSVLRIVGQGTTSRCIWITPSSRGSRFARRLGGGRPREAYLLNGVREPRQCLLLGVKRKLLLAGSISSFDPHRSLHRAPIV